MSKDGGGCVGLKDLALGLERAFREFYGKLGRGPKAFKKNEYPRYMNM